MSKSGGVFQIDDVTRTMSKGGVRLVSPIQVQTPPPHLAGWLRACTPIVNEPCTHHLSTRRDQSVFNRCRIGHSRLTHEFLLKGEPPPECIPCNCPLTINHLLIECVDFNDVRQRFYQVPTLQDLFKTVKPEVILDFLKAAALYRLL